MRGGEAVNNYISDLKDFEKSEGYKWGQWFKALEVNIMLSIGLELDRKENPDEQSFAE